MKLLMITKIHVPVNMKKINMKANMKLKKNTGQREHEHEEDEDQDVHEAEG